MTAVGERYAVYAGVAYVEEARLYALFVQFNDNVGVFTCPSPYGNFSKHNQIDMTSIIGTSNTGDQTVFTDPDTGKSYLCYSYGKGRSRISRGRTAGRRCPRGLLLVLGFPSASPSEGHQHHTEER